MSNILYLDFKQQIESSDAVTLMKLNVKISVETNFPRRTMPSHLTIASLLEKVLTLI